MISNSKKPLLIEDIRAMCAVAAQVTDENGNAMPNKQCRDVCLLLFMFYSAMRRSEIQHLLWTDLSFDKRGVIILIRQSKTDKDCKGQTIALPRSDDAAVTLCPVRALEAWKEKSGGADGGTSPVFRWISKKDEIQFRVLIDQRIVAIIKEYAAKIGLDEKCFAGHSTRSGYVTSCSDRGVPISEMMKRTRHKSISSISVYMKNEELFKGAGDTKL
jgi:integrase